MNEKELEKLSNDCDEAIHPQDVDFKESRDVAKIKTSDNNKFKEDYFNHYNDIKSPSRKDNDW